MKTDITELAQSKALHKKLNHRLNDAFGFQRTSRGKHSTISLSIDECKSVLAALDERFALVETLEKVQTINAAAEKLVRCKGRYHSEQNYRALAALFGVMTPDLPPLDGESRIDTLESCDDDRIEAVKAVLRGLAGNSPVIPDTWIPVSERMPEDGECVVIVDSDHGCFYGGAVALYRAPHFHLMNGVEASNHDGEAVVVTSFEATHWMPLPAGPQEVKGE